MQHGSRAQDLALNGDKRALYVLLRDRAATGQPPATRPGAHLPQPPPADNFWDYVQQVTQPPLAQVPAAEAATVQPPPAREQRQGGGMFDPRQEFEKMLRSVFFPKPSMHPNNAGVMSSVAFKMYVHLAWCPAALLLSVFTWE